MDITSAPDDYVPLNLVAGGSYQHFADVVCAMSPVFTGLKVMHAAHKYHNDITVLRLVYNKTTRQVKFVHFKKATEAHFVAHVLTPRHHDYWPLDYYCLHTLVRGTPSTAAPVISAPACADRVNAMLAALSLQPLEFASTTCIEAQTAAFAQHYRLRVDVDAEGTVPLDVRADVMSGIDVYMLGLAILEFMSRPEMFGSDVDDNADDLLYLVMARLGMDMAHLDVSKRLTAEEADARLLTIRLRFCPDKIGCA